MDTHLVTAAQRGDEEAFATLVVAFGGRLQAVAHRILRDFDLAEDATQQALVKIWKSLPKLRDPDRFEAWSYQILVRSCYAEARRSGHWTSRLGLFDADEPTDDPSVSIADRDQLERAFSSLSVDHRAVVVLHHYLDMPITEVADALRIPVGTAGSRLHYAMKGLHAALDAAARPIRQEATT
jgi:RNA polymerase sigma-70 factor (ECF subfamily)